MARLIGIRHRRKATREGEARPTVVAIKSGSTITDLEFADETAELDFLMGRLPVEWRKVEEDEDISEVTPHHCKWKKVKKENVADHPEHHIRTIKGSSGMVTQVVTHVPTAFDGLKAGDTIAATLGGSGDRYAAALSTRGDEIGARVFRTPPYVLKEAREKARGFTSSTVSDALVDVLDGAERPPLRDGDKDNDHRLLVRLLTEQPDDFYLMTPRDRDGIRVAEALSFRMEAMKARIACDQRILQSLVGRIFLNREGRFPDGVIQDQYDHERANDEIFQALEAEEKRRDRKLKEAVHNADIWAAVFEPIEGCGERLAAGLIAPIGDIRRFWVQPDATTMRELGELCSRLERDGKFRDDLNKVAARIKPGMPHFQQVQIVRSWKKKHGRQAEARLLDEAIACHQERAKLRRKAFMRGQAKLRKFCGVHVISAHRCVDCHTEFSVEDALAKQEELGATRPVCLRCASEDLEQCGIFPRKRRGQRCNWNPAARQTLYLLCDQFNRKPTSFWGQRLRENKAHFRTKHPEPVETQVRGAGGLRTVTRYTDGHIHRMGCWRTASQFVDALFKEWTAIEKGLVDGGEAEAAVA